jgi:IPTL-CTERM motif
VGIVADNFVLAASAAAGAGAQVPTLDAWAKIALALMMSGIGIAYLRRSIS